MRVWAPGFWVRTPVAEEGPEAGGRWRRVTQGHRASESRARPPRAHAATRPPALREIHGRPLCAAPAQAWGIPARRPGT